MPAPLVVNPSDMKISPSGKLLAFAGEEGLQIFHFNGAGPITHYTGLVTTDPIDQMFWTTATICTPLVTQLTNCTSLPSLQLGINRLRARPTQLAVRAPSAFNRCHTDPVFAMGAPPFSRSVRKGGVFTSLSTSPAVAKRQGIRSALHERGRSRLHLARLYFSRLKFSLHARDYVQHGKCLEVAVCELRSVPVSDYGADGDDSAKIGRK